MKKSIISILLYFIVFSLSIISVQGQNNDAYMIVTNPGADMSSEINITWHSDIQETYVEYTLASDENFDSAIKVIGDSEYVEFDPLSTNEPIRNYYRNRVSLTGLQSNTRYIYRVGLNNISEVYAFKTAGGDEFSFLHITDIHAHIPLPGRVETGNEIIEKAQQLVDLDLVVFSGDMVAYGAYYEQWQQLYDIPTIKDMTWAFTPGNHCYYSVISGNVVTRDARFFNATTYNPENGAVNNENATYYFKYNNTLFISIDSEASAASSLKLRQQQAWFKEVVKNNDSEFIVVYAHRPFYTADGGNAGQAATMRSQWQRIFDKTGVDLVLTGHNHNYMRTNPVFDNNIAEQGTVYIGAPQIGDRDRDHGGSPMHPVAEYRIGKTDGGVLFTVSDGVISGQFYDIDGNIYDAFEILAKTPGNIMKQDFISSIDFSRNEFNPRIGFVEFESTGVTTIKQITVKHNDLILGEVIFPLNRNALQITNIPLELLEFDLDISITFHDNQTSILKIPISNLMYNFGSIDDSRIVHTQIPKLTWDSNLQNNVITNFKIYINGNFYKEIPASQNYVVLDDLCKQNLYHITLQAIDFEGNIKITEQFQYGYNDVFKAFSMQPLNLARDLILFLERNS